MVLKAIIFDMDGVIIDSEKLYDKVLEQFFIKRKIDYNRDSMKPMYMGKSAKESSTIQKELYNLPESVDELTSEKRAILCDLIDKELDFVPGFLEYFSYIKEKGLQYIIATGTGDIILDRKDKKVGIRKLFGDSIVTVDQIGGVGKPDPAIFIEAMRRISCEPSECLIIEDAIFGIQAANRAGVRVIGFTNTLSATILHSANPTFLAHSFSEIQEITETLLQK